MPDPNSPKPLSPEDLANQLFDAVFNQGSGDHREAARQVIVFLKEALVYAVTATTRGDDGARNGLLKSVGESLIALTVPPQA